MYYKIVSGGTIVDAVNGSLNYVRWQEKNRVFLSCEEADADGIISSGGSDIYLLKGVPALDGYAHVTVAEITEEEYTVIREELDAGTVIDEPDDDDPAPDKPKTRLRLLEDQVAELSETNAMLLECLLEMSEIVYG